MVYFMENPIYKWMMIGDTSISGNPHVIFELFALNMKNHHTHINSNIFDNMS